MSADVLSRILAHRIVSVMRSEHPEPLIDAAAALAAGGVRILEVTFTVPQAAWVLDQLRQQATAEVLIGAGTVLDAETARIALLNGAEFLVTPIVSADVIAMGRRYGAPVFCGALTPTEIQQAWQLGADIVKVFPADVGGPAYLKAIHGPLPQVRLMPTGGVNLETAEAFLKAGACAPGSRRRPSQPNRPRPPRLRQHHRPRGEVRRNRATLGVRLTRLSVRVRSSQRLRPLRLGLDCDCPLAGWILAHRWAAQSF